MPGRIAASNDEQRSSAAESPTGRSLVRRGHDVASGHRTDRQATCRACRSDDASAPPDEAPDVPAAAEPRIGRPVVRLAANPNRVGPPRTRHDLRVIDTESLHWRRVTTAPRPSAPWLAMPRVERRPSCGPNVRLTDADGRWLAPRASTCVDAVSWPGARDQDDTA